MARDLFQEAGIAPADTDTGRDLFAEAGIKLEPKKTERTRTAGDIAKDIGVVALKGAVGLPASVVGLADIPTGGRVGKFLEDNLGYRPGAAQAFLADNFSDAQKDANQEVEQADGFIDTAGAALRNPSTIAVAVGESLPQMLGGAGVARGIMKAAPKVAPWVAGALGEGALGAGSAATQTREQSADGLLTAKQAGAAVASGAGTAVLGAVGGKIAGSKLGQRLGLADVDTMLAGGQTVKSPAGFVKAVVGSGISEGVFEELPQSVQEQMWANYATDKPLTDGVDKAAAMGLLSGAAMGGAGGGYNAAMSNIGAQGVEDQTAGSPGETPPGQAPQGPGAAGAGQPAAGLPGAGGPAAPAQAAGVATSNTDAAERALRSPVKLTALDRADEMGAELARIDQRLAEVTPENGYGPAFDAERAELQQQATDARTEREAIAKTWPTTIKGAPTQFSTEAGVKLDAEYALVDADSLVTSHDENLRQNPLFPAELQPRDRSRQASEMQVSGIVQKLDPARLGVSADSATGAPIIGADGLVESGNARTIALKRVYQANGQKAENYKAWLKQSAAQFGITPESVDGLKKPVLVRVRNTPVNRAEFARQANQSTIQRMSPSEQAASDAKRLTSLEVLNPDENGEFSTSYDFIRQFMGTLPITEQSDMIESDGRLSTTGYRRIQNAVLAKAYGDSPTLRRMTESLDNNLVNVSKALTRAAPAIAAARDRVQAGALHDADIAPDLVQAVEGLSAIKDKGWTVEQELGQTDLTGPRYSPEAADLLQFLADNVRSPRRIAEFLQRYYEALDAAGDPNQGSLLGDDAAPTRADLLKSARGTTDGQDTAGPAGQDRQEPQDAQGSGRGAQGNEGAQSAAGAEQPGAAAGQAEWVMFPPESGTLGIPRASMPQIKGESRPALIAFLKSRGVGHERTEVPADSLKPTQAEFSTKKVRGWLESDDKGDRSVLISADGYVLDGHHQWMGAMSTGGDATVIRFNAPIKELLAVVRSFPGVKQSAGAANDLTMQRVQAVTDFKDALADLAAIASKHTRAAMVPEDTPNLMPTLVKLFDSAIKLVGTDMKRATAWVKDQLKKDPTFKVFWNKIGPDLYRKAALQALEKPAAKSGQGSLFDSEAEATDAVQSDLFDMAAMLAEPVPKVAMIDGRAYDAKRDNFAPPSVNSFMDEGVLGRADGYVDRYYKDRPPVQISDADRSRAESLLQPLIRRAEDAKAEYDQKIIDIAKRAGAIGQMLAPIKGMKRSTEKLVVDEGFSLDGMKDMLRSTIVVKSYADAQAVLSAIEAEFDLTRKPKNRTGAGAITSRGETIESEDPAKYGGYTDVLVNVTMPNGVIAEIQINVPEMLAAKGEHGHKLYEAAREAPKDSPLGKEIMGAMREFYDAAFAAASARNSASDRSNQSDTGPRSLIAGRGDSALPSDDKANQPSPGSSTKNPPSARSPNRQPAGNLSGTRIASPLNPSVPPQTVNGYNEPDLFGGDDATAQPGDGNGQGQGPGPAQGNGGQGDADGVRARSGRRDQRPGGDGDAGAASARQVGQPGPDGKRGKNARGEPDESGAGTGRVGGIPAGRDIAVKTGRNYVFGPDDLTYQGSWVKKAEQNIAAVELIKTLQKEGRQATRDEQSVLAKFIGWGASDLANNLFGKKLDGAQEAAKLTGQDDGTRLSLRAKDGSTDRLDFNALQALADRIKAQAQNLPRVHVLPDPSKAPLALREYINRQDAWADVEGAMHDGDIYLFSSGLTDAARAEHVLLEHEAAHYGLRAVLGGSLKTAMRLVYVQNASVRKAVTELQKRGKLSDAVATEEVIVDIPTAELAQLKGWRKVVEKARDRLASHGYDTLAQKITDWLDGTLTQQQRADLFVAELVHAARDHVKGKRPASAPVGPGTRLSGTLAEDIERQEKWLQAEARARGFKDIEDLLERDYPTFEKLAEVWRKKNPAEALLSRAAPSGGATPTPSGGATPTPSGGAVKTVADRAEAIIQKKAAGFAPLDRIARLATQVTGVERLTGAIYGKAGNLLARLTPEKVKAGIVSDYGVPEAVIDQRIMLQGRQRVQLRKVGTLVEKLSTLTREESRVAYEWMNMDGADPRAYLSKMDGLPEESVKVLQEVQKLIDDLSQEAVRLGQLDPEAFARNRFAYLRRSYAKHILEQTTGEKARRSRVISILGDQYKGRGLVQAEPMAKMQAAAPDWWGRKLVSGKADTALKGAKFIRLEKRALQASKPLPGMAPAGPGRVQAVVYWPADEKITGEHAAWIQADTWEVRDIKGGNVVLWRDFTKDEREQMGEVDEARFAIAKTMHGMIHDVEVGRYLEWLGKNYAKSEGQQIPGVVVEASERMRDTFAPNEWVKVPDTKIPGTGVLKYGKLAGKYLPGPIWNDLRQVVAGGQFKPFGETYAQILRMWKTSKTALSPAVHMNNIMSNMVMADWQDVRAAHVGKALRIVLAAGGTKGGIADKAAAAEILNRYKDSGGDIGSWATQEIAREQLDPLLADLEIELAATGDGVQAQTGVYAALQHALGARFPAAWEALRAGKAGKAVGKAGGALIDLYQAEDDVFRLAAWLRAKEEGADDLSAGKTARRSFLDYNINAPWVQAMRQSAWPFISFTYRAVPLLAEIAGKKPHKLFKLMMLAGGLNALGVMMGGGGDDDERKLLPEEKAGNVWGLVPKLIRMPWNDAHGSPVYLDIRRWVPVGDVFDMGQGNAAIPMLPGLMPGGPLVLAGEVVLNKSAFTGKPITLETDTGTEKAAKLGDYLYKAFAPNIVGLPGTYATEGVAGSLTGRTDAFGREMSTAQALATSIGVKAGSYPADVLRRNIGAEFMAQQSEIDKNLSQLKRQLATGRIDRAEFDDEVRKQIQKKQDLARKVREKLQ